MPHHTISLDVPTSAGDIRTSHFERWCGLVNHRRESLWVHGVKTWWHVKCKWSLFAVGTGDRENWENVNFHDIRFYGFIFSFFFPFEVCKSRVWCILLSFMSWWAEVDAKKTNFITFRAKACAATDFDYQPCYQCGKMFCWRAKLKEVLVCFTQMQMERVWQDSPVTAPT